MTTTFFAPPTAVRDGRHLVLPENEARHAVRVLRKQAGDEIVVVDGEGGWHRVRLDHVDRRTASGTIVETMREVGEPPFRLSLGLAMLKQRSRFEFVLEKAAELGAGEVIPLVTHRTEKGGINAERARAIGVAAMKQCGRSRLVDVSSPRRLADVLEDPVDLGVLAHESAPSDAGLGPILAAAAGVRSIRVLVGPEGGFTDDEVGAARLAGYRIVSLGPRRLRAETAVLAAASAVMLCHHPQT